MSINWNWNDKIGTWKEDRYGKEWTFNIYECNGLAVIIHEYEENGNELYQLQGFFCDEEHLKNCLGLRAKQGYGENIYKETLLEIEFTKNNKTTEKLIKNIIKASFDNDIKITIKAKTPF